MRCTYIIDLTYCASPLSDFFSNKLIHSKSRMISVLETSSNLSPRSSSSVQRLFSLILSASPTQSFTKNNSISCVSDMVVPNRPLFFVKFTLQNDTIQSAYLFPAVILPVFSKTNETVVNSFLTKRIISESSEFIALSILRSTSFLPPFSKTVAFPDS